MSYDELDQEATDLDVYEKFVKHIGLINGALHLEGVVERLVRDNNADLEVCRALKSLAGLVLRNIIESEKEESDSDAKD